MQEELKQVRYEKFIGYYHAYFSARFFMDVKIHNQFEKLMKFIIAIPQGRMEELFKAVSYMIVKVNQAKGQWRNPRLSEFEACLKELLSDKTPKMAKVEPADKERDIDYEVKKAKGAGKINGPDKCPDCGGKVRYFPGQDDITKGTHICIKLDCGFKVKNITTKSTDK